MRLLLYVYQCLSCSNKFKALELPGEPYGEFLLRSQSGKIAYLNAMDNKVFKEISRIVKCNSKITDMRENDRVKVFHKIFGAVCDPASDGSVFQIGAMPICPKCGSNKMYSWEPTHPAEVVELDVPVVAHTKWNKLNEKDKKALVDEAIERFFEDKDNLKELIDWNP